LWGQSKKEFMDSKISSKDKLFLITFLLLISLHLLLISSIRIYPFIDLPMHLASAAIYGFYNDSNNVFNEFYYVKKLLGQSNIFHLLFCTLKILPSIELANKVFHCIYVILLPISMLLVIKKLGGNPWFSLLSFLMLYNFNVSWGFVGFTFSIPFVLLFIYFLYDYLFKESFQYIIIMMCLFVLIFLIHGITTIFSIIIFLVSVIYFHRNNLKKIMSKSLVAIPILIILISWWLSREPQPNTPNTVNFVSYLLTYYKSSYLPELYKRTGLFYWDNYFLYSGIWGLLVGSIFTYAIIAISLISIDSLKHLFSVKIKSNQFVIILIFFFSSIFIYFIVPQIKDIFWISFYRFSVFCFLSLIIMASVIAKKKLPPFNITIICIVCALHFILWADYFKDFNRENQSFTKEILPEKSKNKKLAGLVYDYSFRDKPIYIHFPNYYIIWKQGISTTRMLDFPSPWRIGRKTDKTTLPRYNEWVGLLNNYDGRYMNADFILVRGELPQNALEFFKNFTLVKSIEKWTLYEKK